MNVILSGAASVQDMFGTALSAIETDVMGFIGVAMPIAIGIAGVFIAIKLGMKFFKKSTN